MSKCGVEYARHPVMTHLIAVCARPEGHDGEHSNVLSRPTPTETRESAGEDDR